MPPSVSRRQFLAATGSLAFAAPLTAFGERLSGEALPARAGDGYGAIRPAADGATGLRLLELPEGFRYVSFSWRGDRLDDGRVTPGAHDGMAAFAAPGGRIRLIRNHEIDLDTGAFGAAPAYDAGAGGGTTTVEFDPASGAFVKAWASLCGTTRNCAGGPTPWGSWLTCEETLVEPRPANQFRQPHGYVFEVPSEGAATAVPLKGLGRFVHEAVAIDPSTGIVYLTEDHGAAGFYRFVPKTPGTLIDGGRLEMLAVDARPPVRHADGTAVGTQPAGSLGADCRSRSAASRQRPAATPKGSRARGWSRAPPSSRVSKARGTAAVRFSSTRPAAATRAADRSGSTSPRASSCGWCSSRPGRTC